MTRFARLALSLAVIAAPAFLYGCSTDETPKPADAPAAGAPAAKPAPDAAKPAPDAAKPAPAPAK
jgi:hypothetical protein